jgi:hypothetical protein
MAHFQKIGDNSENNLNYGLEIMGIEISDDELLAMEPRLLLELQQYLKDYRGKNGKDRITNAQEHRFLDHSLAHPELNVLSEWKLADATFEEVELPSGKFLGTRVKQNNVCYIARNWKMTAEVKKILQTAADLGFNKFWRFNHPQNSYHEGNVNYLKGSHHIGCSKRHDSNWIFVLGAESLSKQNGSQKVKEITFNRLEPYIDIALSEDGQPVTASEGELVEGTFKIQKGGGKCITTHPSDFERIIKYIAEHCSP